MNNTQIIAGFCRELHPEAESDIDAVLIHQKEIEKRVDFKTKFDLAASDDIEMFYVLHRVWNELKGKELLEEGIV